ncbi:MAG: hypothetical protein PHV74_01375 [Dehalococcoidia bacterium]|nr:hypothetical protein [Dehalococcoidia bacterium]
MTQTTLTEPAETRPKGNCVHHWIIEPPEGEVSKGVCKICGTEKEFKNHLACSAWDNESPRFSRRRVGGESKRDDTHSERGS